MIGKSSSDRRVEESIGDGPLRAQPSRSPRPLLRVALIVNSAATL